MLTYMLKESVVARCVIKAEDLICTLDSDVELIATYKVNLAKFGHIEVQNESYFRYRELVEI